jgi:hypothetical protein
MFSDLLAALKAVAGTLTWAHRLRVEDRQRFAKLCDDVSGVLGEYGDASQDRRRSMNLCAELREYVQPIRELGQNALGSAELERVATALNGVCDAWSAHDGGGAASSHVPDHELDQIAAAAGMFHGLANRVRAA